ncbi:MAG: ethanolamine ammonia-lyase [Bacteroidia bacterium]|nr:ethanolamine ammonia-lyase [Bacteroidia bacterium]
MKKISRKSFVSQLGLLGASIMVLDGCNLWQGSNTSNTTIFKNPPLKGESVFAFIERIEGSVDMDLYRQILGRANEFKEGDQAMGLAAGSNSEQQQARELILNSRVADIDQYVVFEDELHQLILSSTQEIKEIQNWTFRELKEYVLTQSEDDIKKIMPGLSSDVIACLVKVMSNAELISVGQKVFNPLPGSKIGSKGYMSARIQPNSPTDNIDDITWQVFDAWSFAVGDLLLGTNPVSSKVESVAKIEAALYDILLTFGLQDTMPNCVLSHIDIQAEVEQRHPETTGIWFQSLAGTVNANQTFDVSIEKMVNHVKGRTGRYGFYAETGQGADFTNGHGEGFDMVIHESRKYGFVRALKGVIREANSANNMPWVFVNDVAGFIGPEVFTKKEQLVRCCLEDTVMGKLHGLTIGLDICSTLHMEISLDDLDWCIDQIMPVNPAYLMALPTKNDPMLSYLTTAFNNHVKVREKFGYKVNDAMWDFFKKLEILDADGKPTPHFGDPIWVYFKYRQAKGDKRSQADIYKEGESKIAEIRKGGVPIAQGYGENTWDLNPELEKEVRRLYEDAKVSLWTEMNDKFAASVPLAIPILTQSKNRKDYVYHPESGEKLSEQALGTLRKMRQNWGGEIPDIQIVISDGLNARALMDEGHLKPFLEKLAQVLESQNYQLGKQNILITHGRVRAGYKCGEELFGKGKKDSKDKSIIHIIGERPGSGHHNFSVYLTTASGKMWGSAGLVDHNITRVVSGISDTALNPQIAVKEVVNILARMHSQV